MKKISESNILIVGMGLMGGSLSAALSSHCSNISGYDRNSESLDIAMERGWIHQIHSSQSNLSNFDWIILALPVRASIQWLQTNANSLTSPTILLDLCSTKQDITQVMQKLPANIFAIGGHPMCGKETNGIKSAKADLFQNKKFILTPLPNQDSKPLQYILEMIELIGSTPILVDSLQHDKIVAQVSHLPHILAATLINTTENSAHQIPNIWELAASGFDSTTRIAASNPNMRLDIILTNQNPILDSLEKFQEELNKFQRAIKELDEDLLQEMLTQAQQIRSNR